MKHPHRFLSTSDEVGTWKYLGHSNGLPSSRNYNEKLWRRTTLFFSSFFFYPQYIGSKKQVQLLYGSDLKVAGCDATLRARSLALYLIEFNLLQLSWIDLIIQWGGGSDFIFRVRVRIPTIISTARRFFKHISWARFFGKNSK
jgi:hypothetical protein